MAIASSPNRKSNVSDQERAKKSRSNCPGVRVIGGRIYDSLNGKTCHQCRQKTMDFVASCTSKSGNKECPIRFCHKCLLNRYGEKAEEVALLNDWECPKCRGICNCSVCMKRRGHKPTGILIRTAKQNGFSSVSELLQVKGPENMGDYKIENTVDASPVKPACPKKEVMVVSPRKAGKENSFDGSIDLKLDSNNTSPLSKEKKSKKTKREGLKEVSNGDDASLKESGGKKCRVSEEVSKNEGNTNGKDEGVSVTKRKCRTEFQDISMEGMKKKVENDHVFVKTKKSKMQSEKVSFVVSKMDEEKEATTVAQGEINSCNSESHNMQINTDLKLPLGTCLTTIAGVELPPEDVGLALQFLEFCGCFGKVLDLKKGQAEAVIREIINGRRGRRSQYSCIGQIHNQLLSMIQKDTGEVSPSSSPTNGQISWLYDLGKYVSKSSFISKELPYDCFDHGYEGYDNLNSSKKLTLLNFLCDEVLNTEELRNWIDDQNSKFLEKKKEAKGKILAAKDKEKQLKKKMQGEVAKAILAKNGAPLTVSDHDAIVSQIKSQAAQAHAEILEAKGMLPQKEHRADAVRTDQILLDDNGRVFWRLNCYNGQSNILLQDMEKWNMDVPREKWFVYEGEEKEGIEKYISSLKRRRLRAQKAVASTH